MKYISDVLNSRNFRFTVYYLSGLLIVIIIMLIIGFSRLSKVEKEELDHEMYTSGVLQTLARVLVRSLSGSCDVESLSTEEGKSRCEDLLEISYLPAYKRLDDLTAELKQVRRQAEYEIREHELMEDLLREEDDELN